jgi:acetyl-CoA C-acetyltransferase
MPPVDGANMLGAAADYHNEKPQYGDFMFPKLFARNRADLQGTIRRHRGTARASRAVKNRAHARLNPFAQMRDDELTFDQARTVSDINLLMAPPLKVSDCSQITDGAAAWFCARNISSKKCNRAGPCDSSALRARRIICR